METLTLVRELKRLGLLIAFHRKSWRIAERLAEGVERELQRRAEAARKVVGL